MAAGDRAAGVTPWDLYAQGRSSPRWWQRESTHATKRHPTTHTHTSPVSVWGADVVV